MNISMHKIKRKILKKMKNSKGIFFHISGIICIIWFLVRVLPKPDRIRYPCQQMSMSIGITYITFWSIIWGSLFFGVGLWVKRIKNKTIAYAPVFLVLCVLVFSITSNVYAVNFLEKDDVEIWEPIPNQPIGVPTGFNPGRVVWVWDPDATEKNLNGFWWEDNNNNQEVIDEMVSNGIKNLAGENIEGNAWDKLFEYINNKNGKGDIGYTPGEKIAIKVNLNNCWQPLSVIINDNERDASPYVVRSLLDQLINVVGIKQEDITVYDASRPMVNWFYNRVYYESYPSLKPVPRYPNVNFVDSKGILKGRDKAEPSSTLVYFSEGPCEYRTLPTCVADADYLINMPLLKRHPIQNGVTLSGKNFFGSWIEEVAPIHNYHQSGLIMGNPAPQVELLSHKDLGGKTVLFLGDGLFATKIDHSTIDKFSMEPFNDDWTNSLFFSQDPIAMDSVMYDFLHTEGTNPIQGSQNYMHQGAEPMADKYDPEGDGIYLDYSLGVHEHWNKNVDIFSEDRYTAIDYVPIKPDYKSVEIIIPDEDFIHINSKPLLFVRNTIILGKIMVEINFESDDSEVEKIDFLLNDIIQETIIDSPYQWLWDSPSNGRFELSVKTYFESGDIKTDSIYCYKFG